MLHPSTTAALAPATPDTSEAAAVVEIALANDRGVALVDAIDAPRVAGASWHLRETNGKRYAAAWWGAPGRRDQLPMHRLLLGLERASRLVVVDHADGDGLNNRRANLRVATIAQNAANRQQVHGRVPFKGVCWDARRRRFVAALTHEGTTYQLGAFADPMEAALAYWAKAQELFGEFAWTSDDVRAEADRRASAHSPVLDVGAPARPRAA